MLLKKFKRQNLVRHLVINKSSGFDVSCSEDGFSLPPSRVFMEEAIGAEYGEGFETFRPDGPLKVDAVLVQGIAKSRASINFFNDLNGYLRKLRLPCLGIPKYSFCLGKI